MSQTYPQFPDTTFPDSFQEIPKYADITQSDLSIYNQYIDYITQGNLNGAQTILQSMSDYASKVITAEKLNQIVDTIQAIQTLYSSDEWIDRVQAEQDEWQAIIDQFTYVGLWNVSGTWSNTVNYEPGMIVYYNNRIWECVTTNTGQTPSTSSIFWTQTYKKNTIVGYSATVQSTDPTFYLYIATQDITTSANPYIDYTMSLASDSTPQWLRFTMRGQRGIQGVGMNFDFEWSPTEVYDANTIVVHNNQWWSCLKENQNQEPSIDSLYWELELSVNTATIPIQPTAPSSALQAVGDVWFQTVDGGGWVNV